MPVTWSGRPRNQLKNGMLPGPEGSAGLLSAYDAVHSGVDLGRALCGATVHEAITGCIASADFHALAPPLSSSIGGHQPMSASGPGRRAASLGRIYAASTDIR